MKANARSREGCGILPRPPFYSHLMSSNINGSKFPFSIRFISQILRVELLEVFFPSGSWTAVSVNVIHKSPSWVTLQEPGMHQFAAWNNLFVDRSRKWNTNQWYYLEFTTAKYHVQLQSKCHRHDIKIGSRSEVPVGCREKTPSAFILTQEGGSE